MNRATNKDAVQDVFASSASYETSRIPIGGHNTGGHSKTNHATTLMNGNGELVYRRSPVSQQQQMYQHQHSSTSSSSHQHHNYYTLGSPSTSTSYNSEETSDLINSSSFEDGHVNNLDQKLEQLQRQVEQLTEAQANQDERYKRARQENDALLNKINCLEDQLRELEINSELRSQEDEKRFKETIAKQMTAKMEECEHHINSNYLLQQDIISMQKDLLKSETLIRTLRSEKETLELELHEKNNEITSLDEEIHKLKLTVKNLKHEESVKSNIISILNDELEDNHHHRSQQNDQFASSSAATSGVAGNNHYNHYQTSSPKQRSSRRSSVTSGFGDDLLNSSAANSKALKEIDLLEASLTKMRDENKRLRETNEELQAQLLNVHLEEGRSLIQEGNKSYSLADEMGDIDVHKLMEALKEQQDDNARLRRYMDEILLKIVEKNPEILEKTVPSEL